MKLKERYKRYVELSKKNEISEQINSLYGKIDFISENEINELTELKDYFDKNIKLFNVEISFFVKMLIAELNKLDGNVWQVDIKTTENEYPQDDLYIIPNNYSFNHSVYLVRDNSFRMPIVDFKYVRFTNSMLFQSLISNNEKSNIKFNLIKDAEKTFSPSGADNKTELSEKINEIVWKIIQEKYKIKRINAIFNKQSQIKELQEKINSLNKEIIEIEKDKEI